jgi:hypothetical protein
LFVILQSSFPSPITRAPSGRGRKAQTCSFEHGAWRIRVNNKLNSMIKKFCFKKDLSIYNGKNNSRNINKYLSNLCFD